MRGLLLGILLLGTLFSVAQEISSDNPGNDWVVRIILSNGSEIRGVVLSNRFVEKIIGTGRLYQEIENFQESGAGIRVWYVRDNPGFVFLPYEEVIRVIKERPLAAETRKEIEDQVRIKIQQAKIDSEEQQKKREERLKKAGIGLTAEEEKARLEEESKELEKRVLERVNKEEVYYRLPEEARRLLEEFPPDQGWNSDLYERIKPRVQRAKAKRELEGLPVAYRKFVEQFSQWQAAVDLQRMEEKAAYQRARDEVRREEEQQKEEARKKEESLKAAKKFAEEQAAKEAELKEEALVKEEKQKEEAAKKAATLKERQENPQAAEIQATKEQVQGFINDLLYAKASDKKIQAIQALGNLGNKAAQASPSLRFSLKDPDPIVRQQAIKALAKIQEPKKIVLDALGEALELGDILMRQEAAAAFILLGKEAAPKFDIIASAATLDEDSKVRFRCIRALERIGDKKAIVHIQTRLWDNDLAVQIATATTLLTLKDNAEELNEWILEPLMKGLTHSEEQVQILASETIKKFAKKLNNLVMIKKLKSEIEENLKKTKDEVKDNLVDASALLEEKIKAQSQRKNTEERQEDRTEEENE